jgi:hypothetical protein
MRIKWFLKVGRHDGSRTMVEKPFQLEVEWKRKLTWSTVALVDQLQSDEEL